MANQDMLQQIEMSSRIARPTRKRNRETAEIELMDVQIPHSVELVDEKEVVLKNEEMDEEVQEPVEVQEQVEAKQESESDYDASSSGDYDYDVNEEEKLDLPTPKEKKPPPSADHPYDKMMHEMNLLRCQLCPESFERFVDLRLHCKDIHGSALTTVNCCDRQFRKEHLSDHGPYAIPPGQEYVPLPAVPRGLPQRIPIAPTRDLKALQVQVHGLQPRVVLQVQPHLSYLPNARGCQESPLIRMYSV